MSTHLLDLLGFGNAPAPGRYYGVAVGIVTNNHDPEELGRVKVKFPWLSDTEESFWARIATMMAGKERGSFFLPEVDDEVLVAFGNGDLRTPFVVGALWNGKDKPPETNSDGQNNIRLIHTRNGHELRFDDTQGKEKIELKSKSGHVVRLDDAAGSEKVEVIDKTGSNKITIRSTDNSLTLECIGRLKLKATGIDIESMTDVKISGNTTVDVNGSAIVNIKGALVKIN